MLRAAVENQLLIYRPDADGVLQDIAGQQWVHDAGILAEYPSKGIKYAWAKARRDSRDQWVKDVPPAPDYSRLDGSPWLHGPNQERADQMRALEDEAPEEEPLALDCRVQDLLQDLTEEEAWNCRHPDARYVDIDIPDALFAKATQRKRKTSRKCNKQHKWAQEGWQVKLQEKYTKLRKAQGDSYKQELLPRHAPPSPLLKNS